MVVVGIGVLFIGYTITYYGLSQVRGGNWGLLDIVIPSRWESAKNTPVDGK
jgi:hypothetical protein